MTPDERQGQFALALTLVALTGTLLAFFVFQDGYVHARPAEDCTISYDYPMCARATDPAIAPPPTPVAQYLALVVVGVLSVIFLGLALKSAVRSQRAIVAPGAAQRATPAVVPAVPDREEFHTPPAIPNNAIPPGAVKAPAAKPRKGPDVKGLEARDG